MKLIIILFQHLTGKIAIEALLQKDLVYILFKSLSKKYQDEGNEKLRIIATILGCQGFTQPH
ncbi:hypothetical protein [Peribacillus glennii]|uniref:Uncharacterized protein n=1 Tax=Peribacillus glennii TaxID=2303991 RepID=A0A372LFL1_9BACI|nr:hypothetical protein [Peribacillus glennii]RFU65070.1 hypothetical protein D0466_03920 [Peribacillus glennii]